MLSHIVYILVLCSALSSTLNASTVTIAVVINQDSQPPATQPHGLDDSSIASTLILTPFEEILQSSSLERQSGSNGSLPLQSGAVVAGGREFPEDPNGQQSWVIPRLSLEGLFMGSSPTDSAPPIRRHSESSRDAGF